MLEVTKHGGVARVTLNRPDVRNAFDDELIKKLSRTFEDLGKDPAVRVMILAGNGPAFCAGADLNWMKRMAGYGYDENLADARALAEMLATLDRLPKPTIARVHGAAFGGGVGLVACCDIAIGVPDAKFGLTESRLGLLPAVISPYVIAAIGARQARRWFASAELFDANEAQRIGLLHDVVNPTALDTAVQRQVELLLKAGPIASATAKSLVRRVATGGTGEQLDTANADLIARLRVSPEGHEGISAFLDKRKPAWTEA
jgi:methylglutaconyl-CoA hydratase